MKYLITYSSQGGNTEKLARSLAESIGPEADIYPISQAPRPDGYDLVMLGFWLKGGQPDPAAADYLATVGPAPLFMFATHGAAVGSDHVKSAMVKAAGMAPLARLTGSFTCQGELDNGFLQKLKAKPDHPAWVADADSAVGHPSRDDLQALQDAAGQVLSTIH